MKESNAYIEALDCRFGYPDKRHENILLENINIKAARGELISLIGKNGSGKTTLLRVLAGIQSLLKGSIFVNGKDIKNFGRTERAKKIGLVTTFFPENTEMTVQELVRLGRYPYTNIFGAIRAEDKKKIETALSICGMNHLKDRKVSELSDGERQRALLARVFAQDTDVILLDEPTSFLDIPNKFEIFSILSQLSREGKSIILTTHDLNMATHYADKLWLINNQTVSEGAPEDLYLGTDLREHFATAKIEMEPETGLFKPSGKQGKPVWLTAGSGCELAEIWTRKAFYRKGLEVINSNDTKVLPETKVYISKDNDRIIWNLQKEDQNLLFTSIYQLINML